MDNYSNKIKEICGKYPSIKKNVIEKFLQADTTKTKKYFLYLMRVYSEYSGTLTNFKPTLNAVVDFESLIPYMDAEDRDIYHQKYRDMRFLRERIKHYQQVKDTRDFEKNIANHVIKLIDNERVILMEILSPEASTKYGRGTRWCITNPQTFNHYKKNKRIFYLLLKENDSYEKFAFVVDKSDRFGSFHEEIYNTNDTNITVNTILGQKEKNNCDVDDYFKIFHEVNLTVSKHCYSQYISEQNNHKINTLINAIKNFDFRVLKSVYTEDRKNEIKNVIDGFIEKIKI